MDSMRGCRARGKLRREGRGDERKLEGREVEGNGDTKGVEGFDGGCQWVKIQKELGAKNESKKDILVEIEGGSKGRAERGSNEIPWELKELERRCQKWCSTNFASPLVINFLVVGL